MIKEIYESARGHYELIGDPAMADVIIGHSFGTSITPESPNGQLAAYITTYANGRPIVADRTLVDAFADPDMVTLPVEGPISDATGTEGGTWGVLVEAQKFMAENNLRLALQVGQAHHVGRIGMQAQAEALKIPSVIPAGLPADFDKHADLRQFFTRNQLLWVPREVIGARVLRKRGQL